MLLEKTEKARAELRPGVRTLGQRERTVLLLADGTRTAVLVRVNIPARGSVTATIAAKGN